MFLALLDHKGVVMMAGRDWDHGAWVHPATEQEFDKTCNEQQTSIITQSTMNVLLAKTKLHLHRHENAQLRDHSMIFTKTLLVTKIGRITIN